MLFDVGISTCSIWSIVGNFAFRGDSSIPVHNKFTINKISFRQMIKVEKDNDQKKMSAYSFK